VVSVLPPRERPLALVALGTALVLVTYVTPMATVPQTVVDLSAGSGARAWILSSMSVGLAAGLLASGALGDTFGRRRVYAVGLALLAAGSLGSAVAPSSVVFVGARVLEGLGGAAVLACGLAILAHAFTEPHARAHATGIWGASVGLGITVGALLAAAFDIGTGWRETYAVVGAVALGLLWPSLRWLPDSKAAHPRRLDLLGVLTLAAALTLVVSGLTQARSGISTGAGVLLGLSALLLVVFVLVERRTAAPMVELDLLRSPGFLAATTGALVLGIGIIGMSSNVPFLVQVGLGGSLWVATWLVAGWSMASVLASLLLRRFKVALSGPNLIAIALLVVGIGQLLALGIDTGSSPWRLLPSLLVAGLATGVLNAVLGREAVANVPADHAAMGSGSNNTARYLGAACGITVFSVVLSHAGSGAGPAKLVDGWSSAVLLASGVSIVGALGIAAIGAWGKSGDSQPSVPLATAKGWQTKSQA
jgi:MFS family permease